MASMEFPFFGRVKRVAPRILLPLFSLLHTSILFFGASSNSDPEWCVLGVLGVQGVQGTDSAKVGEVGEKMGTST